MRNLQILKFRSEKRTSLAHGFIEGAFMELEAHSSHNSHLTDFDAAFSEDLMKGLNEHEASKKMLALMPPLRVQDERFSTSPQVLLDQAQRIEVWPLPESGAVSSSTHAAVEAPTHLLLMARDTRDGETVTGCELVAYPCDANGCVVAWTHRYACYALNFALASQKLRIQMVNAMATLHHIENL
jgi:hypothetical protein